MEPQRARELWWLFEPVHMVTYFAPESPEALRAVGLKGFWMGYFAGRAAPLGPLGPGPVTATFFNFAPQMVARAIPDAWTFAAPAAVLAARRTSAATVLRRLCPGIDEAAPKLVDLLGPMVAGAEGAGRVLFSANRDLATPEDPVEALWHLATCLREHRGDGHVATLCTHGLGPCEVLILFARSEGLSDELFKTNRGWADDEWAAAEESLEARGLLGSGTVTPAGRELHDEVEARTDALAAPLFSASDTQLDQVARALGRLAAHLARQGAIPYPNPVGLPPPQPAD